MVRSAPSSDVRKRILFVDDEPTILASFEKALRRDGWRWEIVFVLGGQLALDELHRGSFDAVVSDMRMPDIDGGTLFGLIQRSSPSTRRIMLTGYAEDAAIAHVLPILHELLHKPCTAAAVRGAIERHLEARIDDAKGSNDG